MTVPNPNTQIFYNGSKKMWLRLLLLGFILLAFARLVWKLDAKNFWWDESLTLQRAESEWWPLLRGTLLEHDGFNTRATTDQHPFLYFALTSILIRVAGTSEFVVRFVSVMAATLLVPTAWAFAQRMVQQKLAAQTTPTWAAGFVSINPFLLWYGQEARPYTLWPLLALIATYFLVRLVAESSLKEPVARRYFAAYLIALFLFLSTQYLSLLLLPVHAILLFFWLRRINPKIAFWVAFFALGGGLLLGIGIATMLLSQGGAGSNFYYVSPTILIPDLLNAFSLGLSVDIDQVRWVDLLYALVALIGALWAIRSRAALRANGWLLPAFVVLPLVGILLINLVQSAYMNARHMSLLVGGFLLLLGCGMGWLWQRQRIVAAAVAAVLVGTAGYSTVNYFSTPEYSQKYDDYSSLARFMEKRLLPNDVVLLKQPSSWRIFDYYLPLDQAEKYGVPFMGVTMQTTLNQIDSLATDAHRVWLITSGTTPPRDKEKLIEAHLNETMYRVQERIFYSHSSLTAQLFLPTVPVYNEVIEPIGTPIDVTFGDQIRLIAYQVDEPSSAAAAIPVTLTWQTLASTETRYKYILEAIDVDGRLLGITEREPYEGAISTNFWQPGQTIVEFSEVPPDIAMPSLDQVEIRIQLYAADTGEKLPITQADLSVGGGVESEIALILPTITPAQDE